MGLTPAGMVNSVQAALARGAALAEARHNLLTYPGGFRALGEEAQNWHDPTCFFTSKALAGLTIPEDIEMLLYDSQVVRKLYDELGEDWETVLSSLLDGSPLREALISGLRQKMSCLIQTKNDNNTTAKEVGR